MIFILVDAIDECPNSTGTPSPREKVLEFVAIEFTLSTSLYLRHQQTRVRHQSCSLALDILHDFPSCREWTKGRHRQLHHVVNKLRPEGAEMEKGGQRARSRKALGKSTWHVRLGPLWSFEFN